MDSLSRDGKVDRVMASRGRVGIKDLLPQRAGAGIGGGGDNKNSVREETLGLDGPGTVRLGIQAQRRVAVVTRRGVKRNPSRAALSAERAPR